jgi:hypothetical protein
VITGTAMAEESVGTNAKGVHHHFLDANASVAEGAAPIDTLSAHDLHMENLRDSGYNPASDFNAAGNVNTKLVIPTHLKNRDRNARFFYSCAV